MVIATEPAPVMSTAVVTAALSGLQATEPVERTELDGRARAVAARPISPATVARPGGRSREAVVAALAAWITRRLPDRTHVDNLGAFYADHPELGRKPRGFAWLTPDLLAAAHLHRAGDFITPLDEAARRTIEDERKAEAAAREAADGTARIEELVARSDALRPALDARDEALRNAVEHALRKSRDFKNASVVIFGSAASGLRTGDTADLDLCVFDPKLEAKAASCRNMMSEALALDVDGTAVAVGTRLKKARRALDVAQRERDREAQLVVDMAKTGLGKVELHEAKWRERVEEISRLEAALNDALVQSTPLVERITALRDKSEADQKKNAACVYKLQNILAGNKRFGYFRVVRHARVPLVKCVYTAYKPWPGLPRSGRVDIDIVPGNAVAHKNSRLLKAYGDRAPAFRTLVLVVKSWASARGFNDAPNGYLSSYAHALTCLHFCLVRGMWPRDFHGAESPHRVEGIDVSWAAVGWEPPRAPSFALVKGYFEYMRRAVEDPDAYCLCCRSRPTAARPDGDRGAYLMAKDRWTFKTAQARDQCRGRLSLEDPFRAFDSSGPHDPAATLERGGLAALRAGYAAAAALLGDERVPARTRVARLVNKPGARIVDEAPPPAADPPPPPRRALLAKKPARVLKKENRTRERAKERPRRRDMFD